MSDKPEAVFEITEFYLRSRGYDGLVEPRGACACALGDLFPCYDNGVECIAGHKAPCPGGDDCAHGGCGEPHIFPGHRPA